MKVFTISAFCFILTLLFICESFAFRCGTGLVSSGDTKTQVLITCGKPTSKESGCEDLRAAGSFDKKGKIRKSRKCDRKVDIWYYNCGENDYIYALTFDNNQLIKETTEGRGKGMSECNGR
jgi:hypothetical protein